MMLKSTIYNYLNIPKLNTTLSQESFESQLPILVDSLFEYGFDNILNDYNDSLKDSKKDWEQLLSYKIEKNNISAQTTVGLSIIKKYMKHIYDVKNYKGKCISNLWTKDNLKKVLEVNRRTHSTPYVSEIIRQLGFMAGTSKVTIYRPLLTKRIVEYFQAKNVLDVCVGWGGRMLGAISANTNENTYTGIEPNTKTFEGLMNMKNELSLRNVTLYNDCAENVLPTLEDEFYDLAITSPPYYNLEIYCDEETQSHHYGSYEEWISKFLRPVVNGVLDKLKPDGKSCWSVKNFKTDKQYNLYDDVVNIHKERGWIPIETEFYIGNSVRPGLKEKNGEAKKSKEITYVFYKE